MRSQRVSADSRHVTPGQLPGTAKPVPLSYFSFRSKTGILGQTSSDDTWGWGGGKTTVNKVNHQSQDELERLIKQGGSGWSAGPGLLRPGQEALMELNELHS